MSEHKNDRPLCCGDSVVTCNVVPHQNGMEGEFHGYLADGRLVIDFGGMISHGWPWAYQAETRWRRLRQPVRH